MNERMNETYSSFMVFEVKKIGETKKIDVQPEDLQDHLKPERVLIILREDVDTIFIWRGKKSPISARFTVDSIVRELQQEFPEYLLSKIVYIDEKNKNGNLPFPYIFKPPVLLVILD